MTKATAQMGGLTREDVERLRAGLLTSDVPIGHINALCDLALQAIDRWVPVSERLPEKSGYYLARRHGEHVSELCAHIFDAETGKWRFGDGSDVEEFPVEHWMPLPPPPGRP